MNKLMIAFAATMALMSFGCKKKGGDGGGAGEAMAKMTEFKDKMCACKDAECAKKVNEEMTAWGQEQAKKAKPGEASKMSDADQKKYTEIGTQMGECMAKAMGAGGAAGSAEAGSAGSAEAGSAEAGSAEAGSAAAGSGEAGSAAAEGSAAEEKKE